MNKRLLPEEYMYDMLKDVPDFRPSDGGNPRVYAERQEKAEFPSVVYYSFGGETTDTNRRTVLTSQDFRMEIRVDDKSSTGGMKNLIRIRQASLEALRKGGRLARSYPPTTIYDPDVNANREIVEVRIKA